MSTKSSLPLILCALQFYEEYFQKNAFTEGYSLYPSLNRPYSRGNVTLRSKNPYDHPVIQPNYLADYRDVKALVEGNCSSVSASFRPMLTALLD